jgi:hypothetical protein
MYIGTTYQESPLRNVICNVNLSKFKDFVPRYCLASAQYTVHSTHYNNNLTHIIYTTTKSNSCASAVSAILFRSGPWMLRPYNALDLSSYKGNVLSAAVLIPIDVIASSGHPCTYRNGMALSRRSKCSAASSTSKLSRL